MIDTWFYFKFQVENLGDGGAQKTICYCLDIAGQYKKSSFLVQILHECEKQAITRYHPIFFLPLWLNCAIAQLCTLSWKLIWPRNAGAQSCNSIQSFAFLHKLFLHFSKTSQFSFIQSLKSFGLRLQRSQPILFPFSKKLIWGYSYDILDIFGEN